MSNKNDKYTLRDSTPNDLYVEANKIILSENDIVIDSYSVLNFFKEFETIEFVDENTKKKAVYVRVDGNPNTSVFYDNIMEKIRRKIK